MVKFLIEFKSFGYCWLRVKLDAIIFKFTIRAQRIYYTLEQRSGVIAT